MADFKRLLLWQKAHELYLNVQRAVSHFRGPDGGSLRTQIVRAANSIPANIVEGRTKDSEREFIRFLNIAIASSAELEYHLIAARDTQLVQQAKFLSLVSQTIEVRKMLYGLATKIKVDNAHG